MMKHKRLSRVGKILAACVLAIGGVVGISSSAQADDLTTINALYSPNQYGHLHTTIDWIDAASAAFTGGGLYDDYSDGHGPYLHVFLNNKVSDYRRANCDIHNTSGAGTSVSVGNCGAINYQYQIDSMSIWVCNGGDSAGNNTVEGGCYGREYYNPWMFPGVGSRSLGTHAPPFGDNGCCYIN